MHGKNAAKKCVCYKEQGERGEWRGGVEVAGKKLKANVKLNKTNAGSGNAAS